jgi:hypothetical protein
MLAALLRCFAGYLVACLTAGLVQVFFVLPPHELVFAGADLLSAAGIWLLLATIHSAIFGAPFSIIALAVAEWRRLKSPIYYAAAGFGIAMLGFLTQITGHGFTQPLPVTLYLLAAFTCTGVAAGTAYWLVAGRLAGRRGRRKLEHELDAATQ